MAILRFEGLTKKFKKKTVLNNLYLEIEEGEIFGLIGKSGCGKTTLLKILLGMLNPNSGKIWFKGKGINLDKNFLKRNTGFASQENMLYDELTLKENILYYARLYSVKRKEAKMRMR